MKVGIQSRQNTLILNKLFGISDLVPNFGPTMKVLSKFKKFGTENKWNIRTDLELKLQLNLEELSQNFENNYHISKLKISIDQVLQFHSRSFASLLKLTLLLLHFHFEIKVDLCLLTFE